MTLTRRELLAGSAALFTFNDSVRGLLGSNALAATPPAPLAPPVVLGESSLDSAALSAWPPLAPSFEAQDWAAGNVMWDGGYSDQPYMVALPDGALVSVLTVSDANEGADTQHVIVLRSTDGGASWTVAAEMEPASAPEAVYGIPWYNPATGRLFVFYTYNTANVREVPNNNGTPTGASVYCLGVFAYRSSIDGGQTWAARREIVLPTAAIDLRNPWGGTHQIFWMTGHAVTHNGAAYVGLSKVGSVHGGVTSGDTEAFVVKVTETVPGEVTVAMSAPIRCGIANTEEPSPIVFDDGTINCTFRTINGRCGEAWSTDDGASWSVDWARRADQGVVPQPRAHAPQFLLPDGRVMLWGHNNIGDATWGPRNPVFCRIGQRQGSRVAWGAPRLLLWDADPATKISYPGLVVSDDAMVIAATDKHTARVFRFPLAGL